ncbi:MAG TPA: hypothetical protein VMD08_13690 [Candidatus Baltobacteraceae bacterium]|nr:hypothetical protein [Candidatus Baltobacteraceae bacterium]
MRVWIRPVRTLRTGGISLAGSQGLGGDRRLHNVQCLLLCWRSVLLPAVSAQAQVSPSNPIAEVNGRAAEVTGFLANLHAMFAPRGLGMATTSHAKGAQ